MDDIKINLLRKSMIKHNLSYYLVTMSDFHSSEYISNYFKSIEFLSNFSGSNATLLVGLEDAYLWTDGRYFTQCEQEIKGSSIQMMKQEVIGYPSLNEVVKSQLRQGMSLGFDGRCISYTKFKEIENLSFENKFSISADIDLTNEIWEDRPSLSLEKAFFLDTKSTGESTSSKLDKIRLAMEEANSSFHIISSLDDIAWIFNLRGRDIDFNPYVLAYAYIDYNKAYIFTDESKFSEEMITKLKLDNIYLKDYFNFYNFLKTLDETSSVLVDFNKINSLIFESLPKKINVVNKPNPSSFMKSIKNPVEIKNTKKAHTKEGLVFIKLLFWLNSCIKENKPIKELDVSHKLTSLREEIQGYYDENFTTISAYGSNASMMHYHPTIDNNTEIKLGNFLLVDSGAHYFEGSTDTTRTFAIGEVSPLQKKHYTYVLKSLISLSRLKFLKGTTCGSLDTIARSVIWSLDLDYRCATGHGVGYFAGVHEGPNILRGNSTSIMEPSMITTIEPGIYIEGSHGIRLENEVISREITKNEYGQFLNFETITLVPFDKKAIEVSLLSLEEKEWLLEYNKKIYTSFELYLGEGEKQQLKEVLDIF